MRLMAVEYRLLGPLAVTVDGRPVPIGSGRLRSLLAALLLRAGDVVSVDELVDPLWSESPPVNPRRSMHTLIVRLRKVLGPAAGDLQTRPLGYRLRVAAEAFDLDRFLAGVAAGRQAERDGDLPGAADHYAAAVALWSGPPLADVPSDWLHRHEVPRLEELRLAALEHRFAVELRLGRHDTLIAQLRAEVSANPLRERFWAQLMRALHATQRQSEALETYRSVAGLLRDELGIDPGAELQRLHQEILAGGAVLTSDEPALADEQPALYQLPPDIADFVGRDDAVAAVGDLLAPIAGAGAVPVVVLWGQAGVGKTATAVHIAHRLRERYPDGQVYVQLAGAGPVPREPADVLAELLRDLGVDGRRVPQGVDRRAAALRTRLADRRILVVLDDAASVSQITPLLPGTASCGVLATSRRWLGGLASVRSIRLEPLDSSAAMALLATAAGGERLLADRRSAAQVVNACGNLPLAVRIAGARLGRSPGLSLDRLAHRLADDHARLDELSLDEVTVRAGLRLSYEAQPVPAQRLLRAMGALSTSVVPGWAVPALLPGDAGVAESAAEELAASSLVTPVTSMHTGEPRLELHDLVRLFAAELSGPDGPATVLDALMPVAIELAGRVARRLPRPANMLPAWPSVPAAPRVPDAAAARVDPVRWFADERPFLLRLAALAAAAGRHRAAAALLCCMHIPLASQYRWQEYDSAWPAVREAAQTAGDLDAYHRAEYAIASGCTVRGEAAAAIPALERCAEYFVDGGDRGSAAVALNDLGLCHVEQGDTAAAERVTTRALALYREIGDRHGQARAMRALAMAAHTQGDYDGASRFHRQALDLAVGLDEPLIEADILNTMTVTALALGRYPEAAGIAARAEALFESHGDRDGWGYQRYLRGIATAGIGDRRRARDLIRQAHTTLTAVSDVRGATLAARDLAALSIDDDPRAAAVALRGCTETFRLAGMARFESIAARLLAVALERQGDPDGARDARVRADTLEPPGNANTARLLSILVGVPQA
jgi:DNA-binding SARP family transcriptional activator